MKFNVQMIKNYSTYANLIAGVVAAFMAYSPGVIPVTWQPYVMISTSVVIAICQAIKQGVLDDVAVNS